MNDTDFLNLLESNEKPTSHSQPSNNSYNNYNKSNRPKKPNIFEKTDIKAVKINPEEFLTGNKTFTIMWYVDGELDTEVSDKILKVAQLLFTQGYKLRAVYDSRNTLLNAIAALDLSKVEYYAPWKFKGIDESLPFKKTAPTEKAYGIAAANHKIFSQLPNGLRARLAAEVHTLLGDECNNPISLIISYNATGDEGIVKGINWANMKTLAFSYRIAGESNIPIYNLKKEDAITRIATKIGVNNNNTNNENNNSN